MNSRVLLPTRDHRDVAQALGGRPHPRRGGFTLIELLITVAIVGVLAAIAYPSFREQLAQARRSTMQGELVRLAQFMERIYSETGCYNPGSDHDCNNGAADDPSIGTNNSHYTVEFVEDVEADSFSISATPIGGGAQDGDGIMVIDNLGQRWWDENDDGDFDDAGEDDWQRG